MGEDFSCARENAGMLQNWFFLFLLRSPREGACRLCDGPLFRTIFPGASPATSLGASRNSLTVLSGEEKCETL